MEVKVTKINQPLFKLQMTLDKKQLDDLRGVLQAYVFGYGVTKLYSTPSTSAREFCRELDDALMRGMGE